MSSFSSSVMVAVIYIQVVLQALMSLPRVYISRNLPADQLRKQNVLSLSQAPQLMLLPTLSSNLPCEFLSLETVHRWILCKLFRECGWNVFSTCEKYSHTCTHNTVGFLLCYSQLSAPGASDIWKLALQDGYALTLYRDEILPIHSVFEKILGDSKNKEWVNQDWTVYSM